MESEDELDYCYNLVRQNYAVDFEKPELCDAAKCEEELQTPVEIIEALNINPIMAYNAHRNRIYVYPHATPKDSGLRCCSFLHELGHALTKHLNPNIFPKVVDLKGLQEKEFKERIYKMEEKELEEALQKLCIQNIFKEGIANHIALEVCTKSDREDIQKAGKKKEDFYKESLSELVHGGNEVPFDILRNNICEAFYLYPTWSVMGQSPYILGYNYTSMIKDMDVVKVIKNPPTTIEQILLPEIHYSKHI
ncbi:MAG: hypothetical protein ABIB71_03125 [Candidatus Woesearchaeota archaeon]